MLTKIIQLEMKNKRQTAKLNKLELMRDSLRYLRIIKSDSKKTDKRITTISIQGWKSKILHIPTTRTTAARMTTSRSFVSVRNSWKKFIYVLYPWTLLRASPISLLALDNGAPRGI